MMLNFDFVLRLLVAGILGAIIGLTENIVPKKRAIAHTFWCHWVVH